MHYKNGRPAKNGDQIVHIPSYQRGIPAVGILYNATPGNDYCNGRIAQTSPNDPTPNLKDCLHYEDVKDATDKLPADQYCPPTPGFVQEAATTVDTAAVPTAA